VRLAQSRALDLYAARRAAFFHAQGFGADPQGLAAYAVAAGAAGRRLLEAWARVTDAAAEARYLNEQNGALIRCASRPSTGSFAHLEAATGRTTLYTACVRASGPPPQRVFGPD